MNLLIQLGVDVDEKDSHGCTVLHHICGKSPLFERGQDGAPETFEYREVVNEKIRALIEHGANLEIRDPSNRTALIRALQDVTTRPTVVDTLLKFKFKSRQKIRMA
jgi:ankyrin repeat protein